MGALLTVLVYAFSNAENMESVIKQENHEFEQTQYKQMFNTLQEGIIVFESKKSEKIDPAFCSIFFINEVLDVIFKKVTGKKIKKHRASLDMQEISLSKFLKKRVFFTYRCEHKEQKGLYSINKNDSSSIGGGSSHVSNASSMLQIL